MNIQHYSRDLDGNLMQFFYTALFEDRGEFEYIRPSDSWISRYEPYDHITLIAKEKNEIIGTLGLILRKAVIDGSTITVGCFVDNLVHPMFRKREGEILRLLFEKIIDLAITKKVSLIYGWDYLKNYKQLESFFKDNGFKFVDAVNWYPSNIDFTPYPAAWSNTSLQWKLTFKGMHTYEWLKELFLPKKPNGVNIHTMKRADLNAACELIMSDSSIFLASTYTPEEFENLFDRGILNGIVAKEGTSLVGVLTYFTSSWGGWMFGRPYLDGTHQVFEGFTCDEFNIIKKYLNSTLASHMLLKLRRLGDRYNFIADVFDRRILWRVKALKSIGCIEPDFDFGGYIVKTLDTSIDLERKLPWHMPSRFILAPKIIN